MKRALLLLLAFAACAVETDVPAAPGYHPVDDDDGGVAASNEALSFWFRPACSPSASERLFSELSAYEGFVACGPIAVSSGQAARCVVQSSDYTVAYRIYRATSTSADAEVYYVDGSGSHAGYRIHCSCPDPVFGGGGCFSGPF